MKSRSPTNTRRLGFSARPLVLLLLVTTMGGLAAAYRLHPKVPERGIAILEVPISYRPRSRAAGEKIDWRDGLVATWTLVRYRLL